MMRTRSDVLFSASYRSNRRDGSTCRVIFVFGPAPPPDPFHSSSMWLQVVVFPSPDKPATITFSDTTRGRSSTGFASVFRSAASLSSSSSFEDGGRREVRAEWAADAARPSTDRAFDGEEDGRSAVAAEAAPSPPGGEDDAETHAKSEYVADTN